MRAGTVDRIEAGVEVGAAVAFASAVGWAVSRGLASEAHGVGLWFSAAAAAMLAYWLCSRALTLVAGTEPRFPIPIFDLSPATYVESAAPDELLLTDAARMPPALPTPGQLRALIGRHLDGGPSHSPPPDASQDLYAALAELRRELS